MKRGSTPTFYFTLPFELNTINNLVCTFKQGSGAVVTKALSAFTQDATNKRISVTLTQLESLAFKEREMVCVQLKVLFTNGQVGLSDEKKFVVNRDLNGAVIQSVGNDD